MAEFYRDSVNLYYKYKEKTEDWEQAYFDAMEIRYDTEEEECLIHLYYWDDDDITGVAQGILRDLDGKRILLSNVFEDDDNSTTVVATIVKK